MNKIIPTFGQDTTKVFNYFFGNKGVMDKAQNRARTEEVTRAAARMIAVIAMAYSALTALTFLPFLASDPVGVIYTVAIKVLFCAIAYDVFTMLKNKSDQEVPLTGSLRKAAAKISSGVKDLKDLATGEKSLDDESRHHLTEGTFLRRLWDIGFER